MTFKPDIKSAIPKQRYRLGEYLITVLHEIESTDSVGYRYIAAVMLENDPEPGIFLTVEANPDSDKETDNYLVRLKMRDGQQVLDTNSRYANLDDFVDYALKIIAKLLNLEDESPYLIS